MQDILWTGFSLILAVIHVFVIVVGLGLIPAVGVLWRGRVRGLAIGWGVVMLLALALAVVIPWLYPMLAKRGMHKPAAMWTGYAISVIFMAMLLPEPLRMARRRLRAGKRGNISARRGWTMK